MASKKIEFHEAASFELEAAFDWYLERGEPAAVRFVAEVDEAVSLIPSRRSVGLKAIWVYADCFCGDFPSRLSIENFIHPNRRGSPRASATWLLEKSSLK